MSKRKRRARARNQDAALPAAVDRSRSTHAGDTPARADAAGTRWRRNLTTLAVIAVVVAAFAGLMVGQIKPSSGSLTASAEPARGKQLYDQYCVACHGVEGRGQPGWQLQPRGAPPLDSSAHAWHHEDAQLLTMILDKPAPDSLMPAWRGVLSRDDALHIVAYMKSLWTPHIRANCQGAKHMNCMSHQ